MVLTGSFGVLESCYSTIVKYVGQSYLTIMEFVDLSYSTIIGYVDCSYLTLVEYVDICYQGLPRGGGPTVPTFSLSWAEALDMGSPSPSYIRSSAPFNFGGHFGILSSCPAIHSVVKGIPFYIHRRVYFNLRLINRLVLGQQ